MAKRQKRQPLLKSQPTIPPKELVRRLLTLVHPSLESILSMVAEGRAGAALETAFLYGMGQGVRLAREDMRGAKQVEKGIDDLFSESQTEVNVKGKTPEEAQEEVNEAVRSKRPPIWTPGGDV